MILIIMYYYDCLMFLANVDTCMGRALRADTSDTSASAFQKSWNSAMVVSFSLLICLWHLIALPRPRDGRVPSQIGVDVWKNEFRWHTCNDESWLAPGLREINVHVLICIWLPTKFRDLLPRLGGLAHGKPAQGYLAQGYSAQGLCTRLPAQRSGARRRTHFIESMVLWLPMLGESCPFRFWK